MYRNFKAAAFFFAGIVMAGCDDVIDVSLADTVAVVNVDAWVTDQEKDQVIYLNRTQNYFANSLLPPGIKGADVVITDDAGNTYSFLEDSTLAAGGYRWTYTGVPLVQTGRTYTLQINCQDGIYTATAKAGRVPGIDSISFYYKKGAAQIDDRYSAEFWARDPAGAGDSYRIKTYRNGVLLNRPDEINIAYDAGTSIGNGLDGTTFYETIRSKITPSETDSDDEEITPIAWGDTLRVEIHSLTDASYTYLSEVILQTNKAGGLTEVLTATPFVNVSTNIRSADGTQCTGFFNAGTVSTLTRQLITGQYITVQ